MTEINFPFESYYLPNFVDPLFVPYMKQNRRHFFNPLTMNINEIKYNWAYDFKKKHSNYPCPDGFHSKGIDYCTRNIFKNSNSNSFYTKSSNGFFPTPSDMYISSIYPR